MHPSYLSLLEKGARTPSVEAVESLAAALDVPPHVLTLLASDRSALRGIDEKQAGALGLALLDVILSAEVTFE